MPAYRAPVDDYRFLLFDVFDAEAAWAGLPAFGADGLGLDQSLAEAVLTELGRMADEVFAPLNRSGDEAGAQFDAGSVSTPEGFRDAFATFAAGGWCGLAGDPAHGGQGMPKMLTVALDECCYAANSSLALYPGLTAGGALLLAEHADEATKALVLPKLYSGEWMACMDLTEPHAGSDLGLLRTRAEPQADGSYAISGTKIFITAGEHDLTGNIVHLVLARLPDAPAGTRGISLFLVPKVHFDSDGALGERNGVTCGSIEEKMGIHGSATCVMHFDGARGWLVGEPNRGLAAMFTMMNYERLAIGLQGLGLGDAAGQVALAYARERLQGRAPERGGREAPADPIVELPDVRRMLLTTQAYSEGGRALAVWLGLQLDRAKHAADDAEKAQGAAQAALFTPLAKAFYSDRGLECAVAAQQVLGGHGYVREWGVEQHVRDARIAQIYEGTNGIQALDLLGRKVLPDGGATLAAWVEEARAEVATCSDGTLGAAADDALALAADVAAEVVAGAADDASLVNAVAVPFLDLLGHAVYAWAWCRMVDAAGDGPHAAHKQAVATFYRAHLLPRTLALAAQVRAGSACMTGAGAALLDDAG